MKLTEAEFRMERDDYMGYCTACDDITTECVEPDAEGYTCEVCGEACVMGLEDALIAGYVQIVEENT